MDLWNLDKNEFNRNLEIHKQWIKELHPELDTESGPLHDIILYYSSLFATVTQKQIKEIIKAFEFNHTNEEVNAIEKSFADKLFGNWLVERNYGSHAAGELSFYSTKAVPLVIPHNTEFTANGISYRTKGSFAIRLPGARALQPSDRVYKETKSGEFIFSIPVISVEPGNIANLRSGTPFRSQTVFSPFIKRIIAKESFKDGQNEETNHQIFKRIKNGIANHSLINREGIKAFITKNIKHGKIIDISVIGFGDQEMQRDKSPFWPGSLGGKCDIYIRTDDSDVIKELQEKLKDKSICNLAIDIKVLPAIPCQLKLDINLQSNKDIGVREDIIQSKIANYINDLGFQGKLPVSSIMSLLYPYLIDGVLISDIIIKGSIKTDIDSIEIESNKILEIPEVADKGISHRTVAFFVNTEDININSVKV